MLALVIGGSAAGIWYLVEGRFPLAGDTSHDFGVLPLADGVAQDEHVFRLRNRRAEVLRIRTVRAGCGCTDVEASTHEVEPRGEVEIAVTLTLRKPEKKQSSITVLFEDGTEQVLWIRGQAVR